MNTTKEHKLLTSMLKGQPSPTVQALRQLRVERARQERKREASDQAKRRRAVDLMWDCEICNRSAACCRCT